MQKKMPARRDKQQVENIIIAFILALLFIAVIFVSGLQYRTPDTTTSYIVKPGDTLWDIAEMYAPNYHTGNVVLKIERLNEIEGYIQPGQVLTVPVEPMIMEATAYTLHEGSGCGTTKSGTVPEEGRTVAVDPKVIPLGTKLTINGQAGYIAEDTGGAVKGNRIDIYMVDRGQALHWGRQPVEVVVVE